MSVLNEEPKDSIETQTEIIAVHTPQVENIGLFPFKQRPSSLPLDNVDTANEKQELVNESSSSQSNENEEESLSTSEKNDKPKDEAEIAYDSEQLIV